MNRKVLFADGLAKDAEDFLRASCPQNSFEFHAAISRADLLTKMKDVEVLSVRTRTTVDREILTASKSLKLVARAGTGVDHIDLETAAKLGIAVMNTASANSLSAAELTMGLLLSVARAIPSHSNRLANGTWESENGFELYRKTLGIIGLGRVGRLVAVRAQAFGMRVIANDPYRTQVEGDSIGVRLFPLEELLERSDVVSLHTPLNAETKRLMSSSQLSKMKKEASLINTARGGIIDEADLLESLKAGRLKFYATDVFATEPPAKDHPFLQHPSILCTPHIGAKTEEAQRRVNKAIVHQIQTYLLSGEIENRVELKAL